MRTATACALASCAIAFLMLVSGQAPPAPLAQPAPPAPPAPLVNTLPAGAELIIGTLNPGFTCDQKVYGYYSDPNNNCRVFHVCWPITDEHGATVNKQWTFICGNATAFNQERLICDYPDNFDCAQVESFYSVNDNFGKIPGAQ